MGRLVLNCFHSDTCLADYWSGHHLPHVQVPVTNRTTFKELREALRYELSEGAIAGAAAQDILEDEAWYRAARAAINRDVRPAQRGLRRPFFDLEDSTDENDPTVWAFFVFDHADNCTCGAC